MTPNALRAEAEQVARVLLPSCECQSCTDRRTKVADALLAFAQRREEKARLELSDRLAAFRNAIYPALPDDAPDERFLAVVAKMKEREAKIVLHEKKQAGQPGRR